MTHGEVELGEGRGDDPEAAVARRAHVAPRDLAGDRREDEEVRLRVAGHEVQAVLLVGAVVEAVALGAPGGRGRWRGTGGDCRGHLVVVAVEHGQGLARLDRGDDAGGARRRDRACRDRDACLSRNGRDRRLDGGWRGAAAPGQQHRGGKDRDPAQI